MAIYLVRHGRNLPREEDPDKSLSPAGEAEVEMVAGKAGEYGIEVSRIDHSPKKRAVQTAEILGANLKPDEGVNEREGIKAMDDVVPVADDLDSQSNVMLVGHLPFMEKLAGYLITGSEDTRVVRFRNGGIVCLERDDRGWYLKWTLLPELE